MIRKNMCKLPGKAALIGTLAQIFFLWATPAHATKVTEVTSPGGITAWLVEDHSLPVMAMEFVFRDGGSLLDGPGKEGTAVMAASLIDEGAGALSSQEFQQALNDQSITLHYTAGRDALQGSFYTLSRYRDQAVELLYQSIHHPRFDQEPVERIRRQLVASWRDQQNDPQSIAGQALSKAIFYNHPYSQPTQGTEQSLSTITEADMRQYLGQSMTRDRLIVGVVGDITPDDLRSMLDRLFAELPAKAATPQQVGPVAFDGPVGQLVIPYDIPQSTVLFALPARKLDDPDYFAQMLLNHIVGGGAFSSLLMQEIRVKRGLAYSVSTQLQPMEHGAILAGSFATQNQRLGESLDLLKQVITDIGQHGVNAEQVDMARRFLTGSFPLRFTNMVAIARQVASMQYHGLGMDYIDRRNSLLEKVTLEDVNRMARELLHPEALRIVIVGQPTGISSTMAVDYQAPVPPAQPAPQAG